MENLNEEFYRRFIQVLKATVPERGELSKMLPKILNIEKMSVYRRLRGEIPFTFAEIIVIARQLNISLDNILDITSPYRSLPFSLHFQDYFNLNEMDYKMSEDYIKVIKATSNNPHSEFGFVSNILPLHAIANYPPIFQFFLMKWMYQFGNTNKMTPYSEIHIPEKLGKLHKEYIEAVMNIKYTFFIFHGFALQELIHDILYFKAIHLLTEEDVDLLKKCLHEALNMLENLAINGAFSNGNKIDIYVSGLSIETSYVYLSSENINISMIDAYTLGAVTSLDADSIEIMKKWMQSIKRTSTIITGFEKNRIEFIKKQMQFLEEI
ncbi:hypothetical protein AGMMS50239_30490 [Bacteroidia bacterium]|nr:hypothetical protein AGMMS50239_30490 [Bacteroidia bacterium]GHV31623.1 hypothetical protein FACS1894177_06590 [Bacteroidia bacterium]